MGLIIQDLTCEQQDSKFGFGFNREPVKENQYRKNMLLERETDSGPQGPSISCISRAKDHC